MEKKDNIRSIFNSYLNRKNTSIELDELFRYFAEAEEKDLKTLIDAELHSLEDESSAPSLSEQNAIDRVDAHIHQYVRSPKVRRFSVSRWSAAAAIFIAVGVAIVSYLGTKQPSSNGTTEKAIALEHDIPPGRSRATLTLADGRQIELQENTDGIRIEANQVKYIDGHDIVEETTASQFNTITTPRGGQYRIVLSDGTKVWLNAASSLRYPIAFTAKERIVELKGEGYFEVTKNPQKPFKVISEKQEVKVLGTYFNINAYSDESDVKTTLLTGSVQVTSLKGKQSIRLAPGDQSVLNTEGLEVQQVDTENIVAWKNDDFIFKGQDLKTTMRQLARWYDVEIVYASSAPIHLNIGGSVSRKNSLSSVLRAMESTNSVKFEFDGKRILVK